MSAYQLRSYEYFFANTLMIIVDDSVDVCALVSSKLQAAICIDESACSSCLASKAVKVQTKDISFPASVYWSFR